MADKGKGKSYWPFKKAKNDFDGTVTKDEKKMSGARVNEGETGAIIAGDMEGISYEGSRMEGLGERSHPSSLGRAKHEAVGNPGLEGPRHKNRAILEMEDALMNRPQSTRHSRDIVEQRSEKTLAKDPQSYSVSVTTIQQQAMKESNFIGSAFFYNLNLYEVQNTVAGDYVIVYTRPKTSSSYPRGSAVELFDPVLQVRHITVHSDVPGKGHPDEKKARYYIAQGYWGYARLYFNGIRLGLAFDSPESRKTETSEVFVENHQDIDNPEGVFENAVDYGCLPDGSTARFGVKEMAFENNMQYGFQFIELALCVVNQITRLKDIHHVVAIKIPKSRDVSSAFLLKQPIVMPPASWYKYQKHITGGKHKLGGLLANVEKVASDWYESDNHASPEKEDAEKFWKYMSR